MCFFFQAEDGIRDLVRSRGLGDVYKRQVLDPDACRAIAADFTKTSAMPNFGGVLVDYDHFSLCLLYTSDAADERSSVDLGGRRIIKKKQNTTTTTTTQKQTSDQEAETSTHSDDREASETHNDDGHGAGDWPNE